MKFCPIFILLFFFVSAEASFTQQNPRPETAFVRSLIVPGWGHHYVNPDDWTRGQVHLATEVALIASYFDFTIRADQLENQYETLASLKAGVNITDRSRSFQLALGDFSTLQDYNEFQLRSRNWNRLFEDNPENRWNWQSSDDRDKYNSLRSDVDRVKNQIPAILGLMVVNRVISAVSAYNRAKRKSNLIDVALVPVSMTDDRIGIIANMNIQF